LERVKKSTSIVILSEDSMILRLTTMHENGLVGLNSFTFNESFRYFHGSEGSAFVCFQGYCRCFAALSMTDSDFFTRSCAMG
jgi:hypothetical protein